MASVQVLEGPVKGLQFQIDREVLFVGRGPENDIQIRDAAVSRKHLKIFSVESCYFVEDLRTRNGSKINGEVLDPGFARLVTENDLIQLGSSVIRLEGIGVNKPPITVEDIDSPVREKPDETGATAYSGKERRSRAFREMNLLYDLCGQIGQTSNVVQSLEKLTDSLLRTYPRIDKVSVFLFDDQEKKMNEIFSRSRKDSDTKNTFYITAILDQAAQDGKISTVYLKADAAREGFTDNLDTISVVAVICLPLMSEDKIRGAVCIEGFGEGTPVRKEDFLLLKTIKRLLELSVKLGDLQRGTESAREQQKRT